MKDLLSADSVIQDELEAQVGEMARAKGLKSIDVFYDTIISVREDGVKLVECSPKNPYSNQITFRALVMPDGNAVIARLLLFNS